MSRRNRLRSAGSFATQEGDYWGEVVLDPDVEFVSLELLFFL